MHDPSTCYVDCPGFSRQNFSRSVQKVRMAPFFENLEQELSENPTMLDNVSDLAAQSEWGDSYEDHPVVVNNEGP
eukprot:5530080-Alexandrium_andersonii.AAC.1